MGLVNIVSGTCWKCTESEFGPDFKEKGVRCPRPFELVRAGVTRKYPAGQKIIEVRDAFRCSKCGELVPVDTWHLYQNSGDIVVRKMRSGKETRGV